MNEQKMYGCDFAKFLDNVLRSATYRCSGANMVVAGLMSDAQELMAYGDAERARQTLNLAKAVLFKVMDGSLVGDVPPPPPSKPVFCEEAARALQSRCKAMA
jgi:hypothetical protein